MFNWFKRKLFQFVLWASRKFSSKPDRKRIFKALSNLHESILKPDESKGPLIKFDAGTERFIIFSDQHKGAENGADDFMLCQPNYLAALDYYYEQNYFYIALGDSEELWENTLSAVKKHQQATFESEKRFADADRFLKIFGNHDLYWQNDPMASMELKAIYGRDIKIHEGVVLQTEINNQLLQIYCTHGHQGDKASDGNWFSKFFVSRIWAPLQSLMKINPNTPAYDSQLKTIHNSIMYDWSATHEKIILITGHTHQPVFESLTHIERLYRQLLFASQVKDKGMIEGLQKEIQFRRFEYNSISPDYLKLKPTYFNSGCCCFSDGDITGIEIESNCIRLIKWNAKEGKPRRMILEEASLEEVLQAIQNSKPSA